MKKLIPFLFATVMLTACEKEADLGKLDNNYLVFTDYDTQAKFDAYATYYLPDSILVIGESKDPTYLKDDKAQMILQEFAKQMETAGYARTHRKDQADLGMQLSYIASTYYFTQYYDDVPWWEIYPGYWQPGYWGGIWGGGWYRPCAITFRYSTGALLAELADLTATEGTDKQLPVIWNTYIGGGNPLHTQRATNAIGQAFKQSPYLSRIANK